MHRWVDESGAYAEKRTEAELVGANGGGGSWFERHVEEWSGGGFEAGVEG